MMLKRYSLMHFSFVVMHNSEISNKHVLFQNQEFDIDKSFLFTFSASKIILPLLIKQKIDLALIKCYKFF